MIPSTVVHPPDLTLRNALKLAAVFAALKLLLQFALTLWTGHLGYGYFRDEFYYIACGRHLAWGYVDHGPMVAVQARLGELLFGDSVFGIRVLSAFAGAVMVFFGGLLTWALGGRRSAQALAMIALIATPQYIGVDGFLSMNSCEPMFWMGCVLALLMMLRGYSHRTWWIVFGLCAGVGLLNKPSMVFFLATLGAGLLCTRERRLLFTRHAVLGIVTMIVIALPNVLWQMHNHWPTLEFLENGKRAGKNVVFPPVKFFLTQVIDLHPANALLWIAGVIALLRAKSIAQARWLGVTYLLFFVLMFVMHAKDYYLAPIYPAFFAAGAVAWQARYAASRRVEEGRIFGFPVFEAALMVTGIVILPMSSPVLKPKSWVSYTRALKLTHPESEKEKASDLPQFYADRFGWEEMLDQVSGAYTTLPEHDRARACVFTSNYGEAGALQFLSALRGKPIPTVISGHNNYWLWGRQQCSGDVIIGLIHDTPEELAEKYERVETVGRMENPWAMSFEHHNIYLLRGRRASAPVNWVDEKFYY